MTPCYWVFREAGEDPDIWAGAFTVYSHLNYDLEKEWVQTGWGCCLGPWGLRPGVAEVGLRRCLGQVLWEESRQEGSGLGRRWVIAVARKVRGLAHPRLLPVSLFSSQVREEGGAVAPSAAVLAPLRSPWGRGHLDLVDTSLSCSFCIKVKGNTC